MGKLSSLLWGAALGAGLMYFMDPQNGNRRQAMVRDRFVRLQNQADDAMDTAVNDLRNRVQGLLAEGMAMVNEEGVPNNVLEERIRSRLGFLTTHPGAIQVSVQNHQAVLSGDILAPEVDRLVQGVGHVRGVKGVENHLRVHQEAGNIPQLQGEGWLPGQSGGNWSPSTRLLAGVGAAYLLLYGTVRGGIIGTFARLGGLTLGTRALTNMNVRQMSGTSQDGGAIQVRKTININAPVQEVYRLWSNFENFPRFMSNIDSIHNQGGNHSHWVVKGPAGSKVEFDAIETENIPDQLIAWKTTPDSTVKTSGQVRFKQMGQNNTQVSVNMSYTPPAGVAGAAVATLFGKDPKSEMDADLARMKTLLEAGKTTTGSKKVSREEVMPVTGRGGQPEDMHSERGHGSGNRGGNPQNGGTQGDSSSRSSGGSGSSGSQSGGSQGGSGGAGDMGSGSAGPLVPPEV